VRFVVVGRFNLRLLSLTLLLVASAGGAAYAYHWRIDQPAYRMVSAQHFFEQGNKAREEVDTPRAIVLYESCDRQLQNVLSRQKQPGDTAALMLRSRALRELALLLEKQPADGEGGDQAKQRTLEIRRQAGLCVIRVAALDPMHAEAHARLMMQFLVAGQIPQAADHAARIVDLKPGQNSDGPWPSYDADQCAARYILAWMAIHHEKPRQPEVALQYSRQSMEFEARAYAPLTPDPSPPWGEGSGVRGKAPLPPRWRCLALEAHALTLLCEKYRKTASTGRKDQGLKEYRENLDQLRSRFPDWLTRVRAELEEPVPTPPVRLPSHVHTIASMAVRVSPSDVPGLLDVLLLSIKHAPLPEDVLKRTGLASQVCAKLTSTDKPPELVLREVTRCLLQLTDVAVRRMNHLVQVEKLPNPNLGRNQTWAELRERIDIQAEKSLLRSDSRDAGAYLALAHNAQREGRPDAALTFVNRGLQAVERSRRGGPEQADPLAKERLVRAEAGLHVAAAWTFLAQQKHSETERHLSELRRLGDKPVAAQVCLIEGLFALQEGRLEQAVHHLEIVRQSPHIGDSLYPILGLAHAYLGLSRFARARANLEKVRQTFERYDQLSPEEKAFADRLLPNPAALSLEYFRCHLGQGHLQQALAYKEHLADLPEGQTATLLLVQACLDLQVLASRGVATVDRAPFFEAAARELAAARKVLPDDAGLAVAEAKLALAQPETHIDVVASAVAGLLLPRPDLGVHLVENLRLRRGLNWHVEKAERIVHQHATQFHDVSAALGWVHWLTSQGRFDEAAGALDRLEARAAPDSKRRLQLERAQIAVHRGQPKEVAQLVEALEQDRPDLATDILAVYFAAEVEKDRPEAQRRLAQAIARHTNQALLRYWQGQLAHADGDFRQAARSYASCLQYTRLRTVAESGLLASLLELIQHESPQAVQELVRELLQANPRSPALLLAFGETALLLDELNGPHGMEGALRTLEGVLKDEHQSPALGAYFLARGWQLGGRPDLARKHIERALTADPRHHPSLLLAGPMALTREDWNRALEYAAVLEAARPGLPEPLVWRAAALEKLGRVAEAMQVCQQLTQRFPERSEGYLAMARALENARDYQSALAWVRAWRDRSPEDIPGLQRNLRLLTLSGRTGDAVAEAEQTLVKELEALDERQAKNRRKPAAEARQAVALREFELTLATAQAFLAAQCLDRAEAWSRRALSLVPKLPDPSRTAQSLSAELVLADVHALRGETETAPVRRREHFDKAIDAYRSIFERSPGHVHAGNNLAYLLSQERGESAAALAVIKQVNLGRHSRKPLPGDRLPLYLLDTMGIVYRHACQFEEAVTLFQGAARRYTDEPQIWLHLGRSYAGMRQYRLAIDSLTRATRLAVEQADGARDPLRKSQLQAVAEEARQDQQRLRGQ
jgi:tetratricopeptide (TPR) repeat protein